MNCVIPTLNIDLTDSVGDSIGKHNYNALSLDTTICNLSSVFYTSESNVSNILNGVSHIVSQYSLLSAQYNQSKVDDILKTITTVSVLSAAWSHFEFSVLYPIDINNNVLVLKSTNPEDISNFVKSKLIPIGRSWLTFNYPARRYPQATIIDLIFFPNSYAPNIQNADHLLSTVTSPKSFTYQNRVMNVNLSRQTIYNTQAIIVQFQNINNKWSYVNYLYKDSVYSSFPFIKTTVSNTTAIDVQGPIVYANRRIQFIKDGTWTVPSGVTTIDIIGIGGGGAGGGSTTTFGGGNGRGGHEVSGSLPVKPGDIVKVIIGGGGEPGFNNRAIGDFGGAGGINTLGYNGGPGGSVGTKVTGPSGGGGGAATVITINNVIKLVAGGGGGGAGAGINSGAHNQGAYVSSGQIKGQRGANVTISGGGAGGGGGGGLNGGGGGAIYGGSDGGYPGFDGKDYFPVQGYNVISANNGGAGAPLYNTYHNIGKGFGWGQEGGGGSVTIFY